MLLILFLLLIGQLRASKVEFTQIYFRHGQRFPTNYVTFPSENIDSSVVADLELGELTSAGIQEAYTLGQNLRRSYLNLIGSSYKASNLVVYSGKNNRTVASALAALASLYPPAPAQQWNNNLQWLPIPVFAMEEIDDVSFGILKNCPYFVNTAFNTTADRAIFEENRPLTDLLSHKTGIPIYDLDRLQKVMDGVIARAPLADRLPLPQWAKNPDFLAQLERREDQIHRQYIQILLSSTGAQHFDSLVGAFDDFVNNRSTHKMHDTNMMTIGLYLKISRLDEMTVPTASYLAFDLSTDHNNEHVVTVYFHSKLNGTREKLIIGLCGEPCPYSKFRTLAARMSTSDFHSLCKNLNMATDHYGSLPSLLLLSLILLIIALIAEIAACRKWKKRYEKLVIEEQRSLLPIQPSSHQSD